MKKGTECVANAVELRKVEITITPLGPTVTAVFALLDSKTKTVVAWKKKSATWPTDKVKPAIDNLVEVLESVAAKESFRDYEQDETPQTIAAYLEKVRSQF